MIPQAGSAYAYSYATLGELVAWIIGWDLILEYAVGNVAVAISWGDYFNTLLHGFGLTLPAWLTTGYRTALLSADPAIHGLLQSAPHIAGIPIVVHVPAFAIVMLITVLLLRGAKESVRANNIMVVIKLLALGAVHRRRRHAPARGELPSVRAQRLHRHPPGRRDRVLRLHRVRRDFDGGRRNQEPAAQPADRHSRRARHLHGDLRDRRLRAHRDGAVHRARRRRPARDGAAARRVQRDRRDRRARRGRSRCRPSCSSSSTASRASSSRWRATASCRSGPRSCTKRKIPFATTLFTGIFVAVWSLFGDAGETYDLTNIGTLFAFILVSVGVLVLRHTDPDRPRPFRVPFVWPVTLLSSGRLPVHHEGPAQAGVGAVRLLAGHRARPLFRRTDIGTAGCAGRSRKLRAGSWELGAGAAGAGT